MRYKSVDRVCLEGDAGGPHDVPKRGNHCMVAPTPQETGRRRSGGENPAYPPNATYGSCLTHR